MTVPNLLEIQQEFGITGFQEHTLVGTMERIL
jgi:hypothetical protein